MTDCAKLGQDTNHNSQTRIEQLQPAFCNKRRDCQQGIATGQLKGNWWPWQKTGVGRGLPVNLAFHNHQPDSPLILHNDKSQAEALHHVSWLMQYSDKRAFRRIADGRLGSAALICNLSYNVHTSQCHVYDMQLRNPYAYSHTILSSAASSPRGLPSALQRHTYRPGFRSLSHLSLTGLPHWERGDVVTDLCASHHLGALLQRIHLLYPEPAVNPMLQDLIPGSCN